MEQIGVFLRQLRQARRLELRPLAARSGLSRRTLHYWEAGTHQPRLPELESVLSALEVTKEERQNAVALLNAARGTRQLRLDSNPPDWEAQFGPMPSGGDLLRLMRLRRGLYLEQVAAFMGVTAATISRWENGKVVPPPDSLDNLLRHLGAREGERMALKQGYLFLMAPLRETVSSCSQLKENFDAFLYCHSKAPDDRLDPLRFLSFVTQAWTLAAESDAGRHLLASICAHYAAFMAAVKDVKGARCYAYRALDLLASDTAAEETRLRAAIIAAQSEVYRSARPAPERGLRMLRSWRENACLPGMKAWLLADMAEYLALQSDWEASLQLHQEACQIAEGSDSPEDLRFRKMDMAKVALRAGQPERALSMVTLSAQDFPSRRAPIELFIVEALLALNERDNAQTWLLRARSDIVANDLTHLRDRLEALTLAFQL